MVWDLCKTKQLNCYKKHSLLLKNFNVVRVVVCSFVAKCSLHQFTSLQSLTPKYLLNFKLSRILHCHRRAKERMLPSQFDIVFVFLCVYVWQKNVSSTTIPVGIILRFLVVVGWDFLRMLFCDVLCMYVGN